MAKATQILRRSAHAFFQGYQTFTTMGTIVLPFSVVALLSQSFIPSSPLLQTISVRIHSLFEAAGFPATSQFFSLLNHKLSQSIFSFLFCLPITVTFFLFAKASIIQTMLEYPNRRIGIPSFDSLVRLYRLILPTHLFNSFVIISANAAVFSLLFMAFNALDIFRLSSDNYILGLSAASAVIYSIVLANTTVACSLATVVSATENCRGSIVADRPPEKDEKVFTLGLPAAMKPQRQRQYLPILKACVLIQGKEATAITVALPASLGMAAIEALFQYRIVRPYLNLGRFSVPAFGEAFLIAYLYLLLIVLDTIISCILYRSLKNGDHWILENGDDLSLGLKKEQKGYPEV